MVKNKTKNWLWVSLIVILIISIGFTFQNQFLQQGYQSTSSYEDQCNLPSCPSGYEEVDTYCNGLKCYKDCEKTIEAGCDDDWSSVKTNTNTIDFEGREASTSVSGPSESTSKCYKYASSTDYSVDDWDLGTFCSETDSLKISSGYIYNFEESCFTSSSGTQNVDWSNEEKGSFWESKKATSTLETHKDNTCSNQHDSDDCGAKGELTANIMWRESDYIEEQTKTETVSCSFGCAYDSDCPDTETSVECDGYEQIEETTSYYCDDYECESNTNEESLGFEIGECDVECKSDDDCPADELVGDEYCDGNNVVQDYKNNSCENYECSSETLTETIKECEYNCEDAKCTSPDEPDEPEVSPVSKFFNDIWDWIKDTFS